MSEQPTSQGASNTDLQKAEMVAYVHDVISDALSQSHYGLIGEEKDIFLKELPLLKFNRETGDATLEDVSIRNIIRESGLTNGKRLDGTRSSRLWLSLLCTLELATPLQAEKAYEDVFHQRVEIDKLSDEDLELATRLPESFYTVKLVEVVAKQREFIQKSFVNKYARKTKITDTTGTSKVEMAATPCYTELLPDSRRPGSIYTGTSLTSTVYNKSDTEDNQPIAWRVKRPHLRKGITLFDDSVNIRRNQQGILNPDHFFDRRPGVEQSNDDDNFGRF